LNHSQEEVRGEIKEEEKKELGRRQSLFSLEFNGMERKRKKKRERRKEGREEGRKEGRERER
jgi:hypothetical protein